MKSEGTVAKTNLQERGFFGLEFYFGFFEMVLLISF